MLGGLLLSLLLAKLIDGDEFFGDIGFGGVVQSGASGTDFTAVRAPALMSPTVRIGDVTDNRNLLSFIIEEIITWDVRRYDTQCSVFPENVGADDTRQSATAGITKDNTREVTNQPTSDGTPQGTLPGGDQVSVSTGTAVGQEVPRYEERFVYFNFVNEANATGNINISHKEMVKMEYPGYVVDGNWFHHLLTARNYHLWVASSNAFAAAGQFRLGAEVRKVVVDLKEVLFDRGSLITIEDAVGVISA